MQMRKHPNLQFFLKMGIVSPTPFQPYNGSLLRRQTEAGDEPFSSPHPADHAERMAAFHLSDSFIHLAQSKISRELPPITITPANTLAGLCRAPRASGRATLRTQMQWFSSVSVYSRIHPMFAPVGQSRSLSWEDVSRPVKLFPLPPTAS